MNLEKGVSIYLIVIIISTLLAVSLNLANLIIGGTKIIVHSADSVKAFYAADSGVEAALYQAFVGHSCSTPVSGEVSGGSGKYTYNVDITGANCEETGTSMISIGTYKPDGTNASSTRRISIGY
ncbi:hypothetical protein KBB74_00310 [Candidatus Parcubacteria bacterium]|nr:hypothetical protein [Candidatus Parcubacteria bacterium]